MSACDEGVVIVTFSWGVFNSCRPPIEYVLGSSLREQMEAKAERGKGLSLRCLVGAAVGGGTALYGIYLGTTLVGHGAGMIGTSWMFGPFAPWAAIIGAGEMLTGVGVGFGSFMIGLATIRETC